MYRVAKIYVTTVFVLNPILSMYGTGLGTLTVFDASLIVGLLLIGALGSVSPGISISPAPEIAIYVMAVLLLSTVNLFRVNQAAILEVLLRTLRYIFYLGFLFLFSKSFFDIRLARRVFRSLVVFATLFLFYQYFALYQLGFYPKGYVEFLPLMRRGLRVHSAQAVAQSLFRPRSIFGEPSQFGIVAGIYLVWTLVSRKRISLDAVLVSVGLIMSRSGTSYLILMFGWFFWSMLAVSRVARSRRRLWIARSVIVLSGTFVAVGLLLVFGGNVAAEFLFRGMRRIAGLISLGSFLDASPDIVLFGLGMQIDGIFRGWPSSVVRVIYYFGFAGLFLFLSQLTWLWHRAITTWQRVMVLVLFVFSVGNEVAVSSPLLFSILPLILYDQRRRDTSEMRESVADLRKQPRTVLGLLRYHA